MDRRLIFPLWACAKAVSLLYLKWRTKCAANLSCCSSHSPISSVTIIPKAGETQYARKQPTQSILTILFFVKWRQYMKKEKALEWIFVCVLPSWYVGRSLFPWRYNHSNFNAVSFIYTLLQSQDKLSILFIMNYLLILNIVPSFMKYVRLSSNCGYTMCQI